MKQLQRIVAVTTLVILVSGISYSFAQDSDKETTAKPKHTIKEVMKVAHKDGLLKKVTAGDASQADKVKLMDLYISLFENKPKKGETDSWMKLAGAATLASAKVVAGRDDGIAELKKATNCKACHSKHKPA